MLNSFNNPMGKGLCSYLTRVLTVSERLDYMPSSKPKKQSSWNYELKSYNLSPNYTHFFSSNSISSSDYLQILEINGLFITYNTYYIIYLIPKIFIKCIINYICLQCRRPQFYFLGRKDPLEKDRLPT